MEREQTRKIIEALLYMADHALSFKEIEEVLERKSITEQDVQEMVKEIAQQYEASGSPLRVAEVAGGVQMATRQEMAPWIRRLYKERLTVKLSPSALETLAIIAYKQPITRSDMEQIRGVEVGGVMETLLERRLVKIVGRKETIGRPLLYGTTIEFLRQFGFKHLSELPDPNALIPAAPVSASEADVSSAPENTVSESERPVTENSELLVSVSVEENPGDAPPSDVPSDSSPLNN